MKKPETRAKLEEIITHAKLNYGFHMGPEADKANTKYEVDQILKLIGESLPKEKPTTHKLEVSPLARQPIEVDGYKIEIDGTWNQALKAVKKSLGIGE